MGLYLRKSFRAGPIRVNLSKSGVGLSSGVKGARVNVGPRGTNVHAGRHGLYYRKRLSSANAPASSDATLKGCGTVLLGALIVVVGTIIGLWLLKHPLIIVLVLVTGVAVLSTILVIQIRRKRLIAAYKNSLDELLVTSTSPPQIAELSSVKHLRESLPANERIKRKIQRIEADIYQAVLDRILDDGRITKNEAATMQKADELLGLGPHTKLRLKKEIFSAAYVEAIQDRVITEEELAKLKNLIGGLSIPTVEIQSEIKIVREILDTQAMRLPFRPIPRERIPVSTQKNETPYYQCPAKVLSRRKCKTSLTGYEYTLRREGTMVLTDKRVFISGDGKTNIDYSDISDIDVDIDDGLIEIGKSNSSRPVFLQTDAPIYAGRAIDLLVQAHAAKDAR